MIIPIFTPQGGCPERCNFCNQKISGGDPTSLQKITDTIEAHLKTRKHDENVAIAFYGGTFTALSEQIQKRYLDAISPYFSMGVSSVRIATRPDAISEPWIRFLKETYRLETVELGVQSFNPKTLSSLGRTHSLDSVYSAVEVLKKQDIKTGLHLMVGCPEEEWAGPSHALELFKTHLERLRPDMIRIHPMLILKGTELEERYHKGQFTPLSLEEAVERSADLSEVAEELSIKVIRLGLQPNEIMEAGGITAGPYHPAFGEMVKSKLYQRVIRSKITNLRGETSDLDGELEIQVPSQALSAVIGQHKQNYFSLQSHFPLLKLKVSVLEGLPYSKRLSDNVSIRFYNTSRSS